MSAAAQMDLLEAIARREAGMTVALENDLNADYRDWLLAAIRALAAGSETFTADDARDLIGDPPSTTHPNVAGSVFNAAAKAGLIEKVGYGISRRVIGNGNLLRVWRGVKP